MQDERYKAVEAFNAHFDNVGSDEARHARAVERADYEIRRSPALFADLDEKDLAITAKLMASFLEDDRPKVGDYVRFADGVERRISHVWPECAKDGSDLLQTSDGGSWYLGDGYCSFSGGLHQGVPASTLTHTGSIRTGSCWFFHHDYRCAGGGVDIQPPIFDEWTSTEEAPR